jgi:predicted dehydrogenase
MKKLRLGLLGTGLAADRLYLPALKPLKGRIEIVACCNRTRSKAERFAKKAGVPLVVDKAAQLIALPQVDAVVIALPIEQQPRYVLQALKAGKAVLSEKPVGPSVKAGTALVQAAKKYKAPWLVAENYAFMPHLAQAEAWLSAGKLGDVRLVEATQMNVLTEANPYFHTAWRTAPKFKGGFVLDAGVHIAHLLRRLMGTPSEIKGLSALFNPSLPPMDTALATMRFSSGAVGVWRSCFSVRYDGPMLKFYGSKADMEFHRNELALTQADGKRQVFKSPKNSYTLQFQHFADVVQHGAKLKVTAAETLADLRFMEAIVSAH